MGRSTIRYLDFDIVIDRAGEGYEARVVDSPAGPARHAFAGMSELEIERMNTFRAIVSGHRAGKRRIDSPEMHAAKDVGAKLFERVFGGEVSECWRSSLDRSRMQEHTGLRVRLSMGSAPELAELPWEFLYDAAENQFLSLSVYTPLVRYLEIRRPVQPLTVAPPLRVLVMISSPSDIGDLDVEEEWRQLRDAVGDLEARGLVAFDRLDRATLEELQRQLRRAEYHVFHYIGHAGFDDASDDGLLVLENERGRSQLVSAERLGYILHDEDTLRLAILNACEGARSSRKDPFSGLAQSLVQKGVPAVIAMQYEISDDAAIGLSHEFYRALGEGYPADAALGEARKMISNSNELEWGTPVLFMRSPDGTLFEVQEADEASRRSGRVHQLVRDARAALAAELWSEAAEKAAEALALDASHIEAAGIAAQAQRSDVLIRLYREGCEAQAAGRWKEALDRFQEVRAKAGNFRDVDGLIDRAHAELEREQLAATQQKESQSRADDDHRRRQEEEEERLRRERDEARDREERILAGIQKVAGAAPAAKRRWLPGCSIALSVSFAGLVGIIGLANLNSGSADPGGLTGAVTTPPASVDPVDNAGTGVTPQPSPPPASPPAPPPAPPPPPPPAPAGRDEGLRREIRDAVARASAAEAESFRAMNASALYATYGGAALQMLLANMAELAATNMHLDATLEDREFRSFDVSSDGMTATVSLVEIWTTEFHQNGTDQCLGRIPSHPHPQRLTLSRASGSWLVMAVESSATSPEPVPCY